MDLDLTLYVQENLSQELNIIKNSIRNVHCPELNEFEKAIIYHYTDYGYESINEPLRNNRKPIKMGNFLNYALDKLPNYKLLCYRTIKCEVADLKKYYEAFQNNTIIIENSFLSCSKSKSLSLQFSNSPIFVIKSKRGKEIEKIAKFGIESGQNEKEILFMSNSKFKVLDITDDKNRIVITLEEI